MILGTSKQHFAKTFWFQEKPTAETYLTEFVETKLVTIFQSLFLYVIIKVGSLRQYVIWKIKSITERHSANLFEYQPNEKHFDS